MSLRTLSRSSVVGSGNSAKVPAIGEVWMPALLGSRDLWSAVESVHLPQYSHTAVTVGSSIIVVITVLMTVAVLVASWSY
ncbi:hypothetical protein [Mycobacterium asiaticum]|uniref:hypothetical protein n=1 Tax=Mycobacterium asiaticum TaxID=1790 RepID=UPI0012DB4355|nr:hypothetical protein [Mycobacterium asiaticum]